MRLLLSAVLMLLLLLLAEGCCEDARTSSSEDASYWSNNNDIQDEWLPSVLRRMTRKPRPHQFFGLMGKRSSSNAQITRKRHRLNSFVGLMGKRSQEEPDSYEWTTLQSYDKRR